MPKMKETHATLADETPAEFAEAQATNPSAAGAQPATAAPAAKTKKPRKAGRSAKPKPTKIDILLDLLRQPGGASVTELAEATGWQVHSVRGAMSGHIKKKLGLEVVSEKTEGGRVYRLSDAETCA